MLLESYALIAWLIEETVSSLQVINFYQAYPSSSVGPADNSCVGTGGQMENDGSFMWICRGKPITGNLISIDAILPIVV